MKKQVMLVDDDRDIRDALAEVLTDEGYSVVVAKNGVDAIRQLRAGLTPNLMLVDVMMPEMDGFELCELCSKDPRFGHVPRFLITATPRLEARAGKSAALGMLEKPIAIDDLLRIVQKYVD